MKFTEGVKYFFSSCTVDCTISLFYSNKEFVTKHGKGNCEETCHQGTVEGNWKSGVDPKPAPTQTFLVVRHAFQTCVGG